MTIPVKGNIIRSGAGQQRYVCINHDLVEEVIERQLRKYKNKIGVMLVSLPTSRKKHLDKDCEEDEEVKIIRTKKLISLHVYPEDVSRWNLDIISSYSAMQRLIIR